MDQRDMCFITMYLMEKWINDWFNPLGVIHTLCILEDYRSNDEPWGLWYVIFLVVVSPTQPGSLLCHSVNTRIVRK